MIAGCGFKIISPGNSVVSWPVISFVVLDKIENVSGMINAPTRRIFASFCPMFKTLTVSNQCIFVVFSKLNSADIFKLTTLACNSVFNLEIS
jgi:hypothetical protein